MSATMGRMRGLDRGPGLRAWTAFALALSLACGSGPAYAQWAAFPVTYINPSPRSRAMGGTGAAVPGDDAFAPILNPAHLSDAEGVTWASSRTGLVPRLANDVRLRADALILGAAGVGLSLSGRPFNSLGGTTLDYGPVPAVGENGLDSSGTVRSYEEVRDFGMAFHALGTVRGLASLAGWRLPPVQRYAEVALGWRWKRFRTTVPLLFPVLSADSLEGAARDFGIRLRVSPVHNLAGEVRGDREMDGGNLRAIGGLAVDVYAGVTWTNSAGDELYATRYAPEPGTGPTRIRRAGYGVRAYTGLPGFLQPDDLGESPRLGRWLGPTLSLSVAAEKADEFLPVTLTASGDPFSGREYYQVSTGWGAELVALGVLALRAGHMDESASAGASGGTWGFGLNLHYGDAVSFRYDWASYPLPYEQRTTVGVTEPVRAHPWSWRVDVNPYGVLKVLLGE